MKTHIAGILTSNRNLMSKGFLFSLANQKRIVAEFRRMVSERNIFRFR